MSMDTASFFFNCSVSVYRNCQVSELDSTQLGDSQADLLFTPAGAPSSAGILQLPHTAQPAELIS